MRTKMDKKHIMMAIQNIRDSSGDYEVAHSMEDGLYRDFIKDIAERNDHIGELAKLVLSTKKIEFARYST